MGAFSSLGCMPQLDIRRLAAVDMYGTRGSSLRRRLIVAEIIAGATVGTALGVLVAIDSSSGWQLFGLWLAGTCLNYVPLSLHAVSLLRPGALSAELAGVDVAAEHRSYTRQQVWIAVPLLFVALSLVQLRGRRTETSS